MFELNYEAREKKTRMAEVWQAAEKSAKLGSKIESNLERNGGVLEKTVEKEVDYTPKRRLSGEKIPRRKKGFFTRNSNGYVSSLWDGPRNGLCFDTMTWPQTIGIPRLFQLDLTSKNMLFIYLIK